MKKVIIVFLIIMLLPVHAFAEDNFISDIVNGQAKIKDESSIFGLTVDITREAIEIMNEAKNYNEAVELLDKLLKEYEIEDETNPDKLLNVYLYYETYFKEEFEEDLEDYIEYNKEDEVFRVISSAILNVIDKMEESVDYSKSNAEKINAISKILDQYNLANDLEVNGILCNYYDMDDESFEVFREHQYNERVYYRIQKLINEMDGLKSEEERINVIGTFLENLYINDTNKLEAKEILKAYNHYKEYDDDAKEEALYERSISIIKNNNIKDKVYDMYEEIIDDIYDMEENHIEEKLCLLLEAYGIESVVDRYDLIDIYNDCEAYGYKNREDAILKEGLSVLDISCSEKEVNDIIDKIVHIVNDKTNDYKKNDTLDQKTKEMISEEVIDALYDIFDYKDMNENINTEKIIEACRGYKEGYDYDAAVMAAVTEMFDNSSLHDKIINIINDIGDVNEIEKIIESVSDYIEESKFEKYIDYDGIYEITKSNQNYENAVKAIAATMIDAIVASNEEDILKAFEKIIEEIYDYSEQIIRKDKMNQIRNVLEEYHLQDYVYAYEAMKICINYKDFDYDCPEEALYKEIFKKFTRAFSKEEKIKIANEIIKAINKAKTNIIISKDQMEWDELGKDSDHYNILNMYYNYEIYGYDSAKEAILEEIIINRVAEIIEQKIIIVINNEQITDENCIEKEINRILKNNDLDNKINALKIMDIYHHYKQYGYDNPAEALSKTLEKLYDFLF